VVEAIRGADFLLLVTEPTPFGLHDLRLAVQLGVELEISLGVVINRDGVGNTQVETFCQQTGIRVLMRIPLDRKIGAGIAQGKSLIEIQPEFQARFQAMFDQIVAEVVS
jgi:MinD superfamily P-loop ATPase